MNINNNFTIRPRLSVLSKTEIEALYQGALEVLEKIGIQVLHPEALRLLKRTGCSIEKDSLVKINSVLVEKSIRSAPKSVLIYSRDGRPVMKLGGKNTGGINTYYGTGSDLTYTYDPYTGKLRHTLVQDIANMAKLVDYLPNFDFVMSYGLPSDCPPERIFRTEFIEMVKNSTKPIVFTSDNGNDARKIIEMAAILAGNSEKLRKKPFIISYSQPTSPLRHTFDALGKVLVGAEMGIPVVYPPGMIPGATAPSTVAGAIIQSLAEALSGIVIHQLKRPGAPIILCGAHGSMDMSTGVNVYAAPERSMTQFALSSVYQYFGIPTWGFGGCTDAQILDGQAGMEFSMLTLWASLCGINLAHDTGYLGSGMIGDLKAIVFNDEIIGSVRHLLCNGIKVDNETKAIDVIKRVGPGGNFLSDEHTLSHFRKEFWHPSLLNRLNLNTWKKEGQKKLPEKLGEKVKEILRNHNPALLSKPEISKMEEIVSQDI